MLAKPAEDSPRNCSGLCLFFMYLACYLLVVFYVNMYQSWAWVYRQIGPGILVKLLPIAGTLVVLAGIIYCFARRVNNDLQIKYIFLGLGIVVAFFALAIPDPNIPIKRIHVAEYIILSFAVRYALSKRMSGAGLTFFTVLVTMLYGIHDEMLQGLHSLRFYGWRDMIVNAVAGLSGALMGHGLLSFENEKTFDFKGKFSLTMSVMAVYALLLVSVVFHAYMLYQQRGSDFSYIRMLPLAGMCALAWKINPDVIFDSRKNNGLQSVFWLSFGFLVYPLAANIFSIEFM